MLKKRTSISSRVVLVLAAATIVTSGCGGTAQPVASSSVVRDPHRGSFDSDPCELRTPFSVQIDGDMVTDGVTEGGAKVTRQADANVDVVVQLLRDETVLEDLGVSIVDATGDTVLPVPETKVKRRGSASVKVAKNKRKTVVKLKGKNGKGLEPGVYRILVSSTVSGPPAVCGDTRGQLTSVYELELT